MPAQERQRKRRAEQEFVTISAEINAEETGLQRDNVRDLVVEVRKKVPTLVIDGNGPAVRSEQFARFQLDAPSCENCGAITVRNGNCYLCHNCGNSMGCS